jgi:hypothetical protein
MTTDNDQVQSTADIAYGTENGDGLENPSTSTTAETSAPLLADSATEDFNQQWTAIQGRFVDAPREAVREADGLVAEVIQQLAKTFADERASLESQWDRGDDVDTEALRVALQRYRSFFQRLLAA